MRFIKYGVILLAAASAVGLLLTPLLPRPQRQCDLCFLAGKGPIRCGAVLSKVNVVALSCGVRSDHFGQVGQICLVDFASGQATQWITGPNLGIISAFGVTSDEETIVAGDDNGKIWRWDRHPSGEFRLIRAVPGGRSIDSLALSRANRSFAISRYNEAYVGSIDDAGGLSSLTKHKGRIGSLAFSPDGKLIASGDANGSVNLTQVATGASVATWPLHQRAIAGLVFSPDGATLATAGGDGFVKLINVPMGGVRHSLSMSRPVYSIAFSPDGKRIASGGDEIVIWDVSTGTPMLHFNGHSDLVTWLGFSPDGIKLISGSLDGCAKVWDLATP